jgi:hypothetical protein
MNEEVNVVEPVSEEGQSPVEVGFDIYGMTPEPNYSNNQGKPRMHLDLPCVLTSFTSLMTMLCLHYIIGVE